MREERFVLASHNKAKLIEMRDILGELGIRVISQAEAGVDVEPEETGATFEENALIKAKAVMAASGLPAVADDSGLMVDALDGAPGVYSARYGGGHDRSDAERNALLLKNLENVEQRGANGFGYDPLFLLPDGRHMAELSSEEKNGISHRGNALRELKRILTELD